MQESNHDVRGIDPFKCFSDLPLADYDPSLFIICSR